MKRCRHLNLLVLLLAGSVCDPIRAQSRAIQVKLEGDHLSVGAPQMHFLEGKPLERLHNGASVTYVLDLTLTAHRDNSPVFHMRGRFILSFDLWEERYSAAQVTPPGRSSSHMTAPQTEAWCLANMAIPLSALPPEKDLVIKLDCWTAGIEDEGGDNNHSGLTLAGLVEVFSRKEREASPRWQAVSGPVRLADLKGKKN